jgi:cyclic pyranopterin phosphate synthase
VYDKFNRSIDYLRISVTDRCNLRCHYCMPEEGIPLLRHEDILTFDEITDFTRTAVAAGIKKVKITGGEPLVRRGIVTLVKKLGSISGIIDLSMTTNGILLEKFAQDLSKAGLHRVNISLDTMDPQRYLSITKRGDIYDVFKGIEAAIKANLVPVKINCVVRESKEEEDAREVSLFCKENGLELRFIREMDLIHGRFSRIDGGTGGNCQICNRLRLTSNGKLKPCLFNDSEFDVRELGYRKAIELAIVKKPAKGTSNLKNSFFNIGG